MQGGKNWILLKKDKCKPVLLRLSLDGKTTSVPLWTEWLERGYGLCKDNPSKKLHFIAESGDTHSETSGPARLPAQVAGRWGHIN